MGVFIVIFEQEYIIFEILDVLYLDQSFNKRKTDTNRNFDALSFRYEADTIIQNKNQQIDFHDNSIGYFPEGRWFKSGPCTQIIPSKQAVCWVFSIFNKN